MTKIENNAILYFLQDHKLTEKELYEEFYDHIVSSFFITIVGYGFIYKTYQRVKKHAIH